MAKKMRIIGEASLAARVRELRAAAASVGGGAHTLALLAACRAEALDDPRSLVDYHDCLLFLLAYPESSALLRQARVELARVAGAARVISESDDARARRVIDGTGITWSEETARFSLDICRWLSGRYPAQAVLSSVGDSGTPAAEILALAFPAAEAETLASAGGDDPLSMLLELAGRRGGHPLAWLVRAVDRIDASPAVREHLFESMHPFVTLRFCNSSLARTWVRGLPAAAHYQHTALDRQVEFASIIRARPPAPTRLRPRDRIILADAARATLCALARETDPITAMAIPGIAHYSLGRGTTLALYPTRPDRRHALDAHVGYLLMRNRIPVGYGGGWPFGESCRIGINIFPAFRGGESAWMFAQVLRVYRHRYGARRFVVEPSQFGQGNREGVQSGAFWFYYRQGFRPVLPRVAALAEAEFARMGADKAYRTPPATLRRLARSDIEYRIGASPRRVPARDADPDPSDLAQAVSTRIARHFRGDRDAAEKSSRERVRRALGVRSDRRWPADERMAFDALALVVDLIPNLEDWSAEDRRACVKWMRAKGRADDAAFFRGLVSHRRLREALARAARR